MKIGTANTKSREIFSSKRSPSFVSLKVYIFFFPGQLEQYADRYRRQNVVTMRSEEQKRKMNRDFFPAGLWDAVYEPKKKAKVDRGSCLFKFICQAFLTSFFFSAAVKKKKTDLDAIEKELAEGEPAAEADVRFQLSLTSVFCINFTLDDV
jgi:hypothetical protein